MNQIKFAGLEDHLSASLHTPGKREYRAAVAVGKWPGWGILVET
jgi:hypothetical protein